MGQDPSLFRKEWTVRTTFIQTMTYQFTKFGDKSFQILMEIKQNDAKGTSLVPFEALKISYY